MEEHWIEKHCHVFQYMQAIPADINFSMLLVCSTQYRTGEIMWLLRHKYEYSHKCQPSISRYSTGLMFKFLITTDTYEAENATVAAV